MPQGLSSGVTNQLSDSEKKGLLFGSLIAAGVNAARGGDIQTALAGAVQGAGKAYLGGITNLQDMKVKKLHEDKLIQDMEHSQNQDEIARQELGFKQDAYPLEVEQKRQSIAASKANIEAHSFDQKYKKEQGEKLQNKEDEDLAVGMLQGERQAREGNYNGKASYLDEYIKMYPSGRKDLMNEDKNWAAEQASIRRDKLAEKRAEASVSKNTDPVVQYTDESGRPMVGTLNRGTHEVTPATIAGNPVVGKEGPSDPAKRAVSKVITKEMATAELRGKPGGVYESGGIRYKWDGKRLID